MAWIDRPAYLSRIVPFQNKPLIKVLTGMRRVGKSSLLRLLTEWYTIKDDSDLTITGSNAGLLSSELATRIAGRYVQFPVLPLTYGEYLHFGISKLCSI